MFNKNLERYLNSFGKQVMNRSKSGLQKAKGSTALENSIKFQVKKTSYGYAVEFVMDYYGNFLDKGVSGNKIKQTYKSWDNKNENSPGKGFTTKGPPVDILSKWIKKKGIKPKGLGRGRSKNTGQFISGFAYLISAKIRREGIKSLAFFQKPLGKAMKTFDSQVKTAIAKDIRGTILGTNFKL